MRLNKTSINQYKGIYMTNLKSLSATSLLWIIFSLSCIFSAHANNNGINVQVDSCSMDLNGTLGFQNEVLTLTTPELTVVIDEKQNLSVNEQSVPLNKQQRAAVESYYYNLKAAIPIGVEFAAQSLEVANLAVNEVFAELLGSDDELITKMNELMNTIEVNLKHNIYAPDGSIFIDPKSNTSEHWASPEWEAEFAEAIQHAINESMGRLFMAIGKEMLFGDGEGIGDLFNPDAFGVRMEQKMMMHAKALGESAELLCEVLHSAETAELQLATRIPSLANLNMVTIIDNTGQQL